MTTPRLQVPETLLDRGVAILPGTTDGLGVPLVIIKCGELEQCELIALLLHYLNLLTSPVNQSPSVACLIDLHNATKSDVTTFVESVQAVERPKRGRIGAVYCVRPKSSDRYRQLKKLLGLKRSKKTINVPLFKVIVVKTPRDLYIYMDLSQVTSDFGGSLQYNHQAWLYFHKTVIPIIEASEDLLQKLPAVKDKLELLQDYDLGDKPSDQLLRFRQEQLQQYQTVLKETRLEEIISDCKQILHLLETPDNVLIQVHVGTLTAAECRLRDSYRQLVDDQKELSLLWAAAENRINVTHRAQKCRERAAKIHYSILHTYKPQLEDHPAVGSTLSQAELYRTHFTTTLYEPSKDLLTQATETLETLRRLSEESPEVLCDMSGVTRQLTDAISPFAEDLQRLQDIYVSVHVFHLLFEKSAHWYRKVLKFLPESLNERVDPRFPNRLIHTPPEWAQAVISFLNKHPPPREEHILRLDANIPHQVERRLKQEAHSLALRVRFLQRLLKGRRLPTKLVIAAFKWKEEVTGPVGPPVKTTPVKPKHYVSAKQQNSSNSITKTKPVKPKRTKPPKSKSQQDTDDKKRSNYARRGSKDRSSSRRSSVDSDNFILKKKSDEPYKDRDERFVRLTFSPASPVDTSRRHFSFDERDLMAFHDNQYIYDGSLSVTPDMLESESGIDVADQEDQYDMIVNKIREVSVSRLPSELKLKYVTDLLHASLKRTDFNAPGRTHRRPSFDNLSDGVLYSSVGVGDAESLYNFDDFMKEQIQLERKYKGLTQSLSPSEDDFVYTVLRDKEAFPSDKARLRSTMSMNDLDRRGSEEHITSMHGNSVSDMQDYQDSMTVITYLDDDHRASSVESLIADSSDNKLQQRLDAQSKRVKEQAQYDSMQLEIEAKAQDDVEARLRRAERILMEQDPYVLSLETEEDSDSHPPVFEKQMSSDPGYDSTSSQPVTPSQGSNTSTLVWKSRHVPYVQPLRTAPLDPLSGPDFY